MSAYHIKKIAVENIFDTCKLLTNMPCFHTNFPTQFQPSISIVSDQKQVEKLERQFKRVSQFCQLETTPHEFSINGSLWRPFL